MIQMASGLDKLKYSTTSSAEEEKNSILIYTTSIPIYVQKYINIMSGMPTTFPPEVALQDDFWGGVYLTLCSSHYNFYSISLYSSL